MIFKTFFINWKSNHQPVVDGQKKIEQSNKTLIGSFDSASLAGKKLGDVIGKSLSAALGPLTGFLAAGAVVSGLKQQATEMRDLALQAKNLQASAEDIYAIRQAFAAAGAGAGEADQLFTKLQQSSVQLANFGTSSLIPAFRMLGLSLVEPNGRIKTATELLPDLAERIGQVSLPRQQLIAEQLGLTPQALELLRKGKTGVAELVETMRRTAPSKEQMESAKQLSVALSAMGVQAKYAKDQFLFALAPGFKTTVDALSALLAKVGEFFGFLGEHTPFVIAFSEAIGAALIPVIWKLTAALYANPIAWFVAIILAASVAIAAITDDIYEWTQGNDSLIGSLASFEKFKAFFEGIGKTISGVIDLIGMLWDAAKKVFSTIGEWIGKLGGVFSFTAKTENDAVAATNKARNSPYTAVSNSAISRITNTSQKRDIRVNVQGVTVNTQATDAPGVAQVLGDKLRDSMTMAVMQMDDGTIM